MSVYYKVVNEHDRSSCSISTTRNRYSENISYKEIREKYTLYYTKDSIVEAVPDSIGILVFNTRKNAERFKQDYISDKWIIVKVKGIGIRSKPKWIALWLNLNSFYNKRSNMDAIMYPPKGTYAFQSVKVLE